MRTTDKNLTLEKYEETKLIYNQTINIFERKISINDSVYFIADIAANHDGDLVRAKELIWKAKESGADCAKFQHFLADQIVSDVGFASLKTDFSHQAKWKKSVYDIYDQYHTHREWTEELVTTCQSANIDFMTTPYDFEAIDTFAKIVPAFKIGSGDITFLDAITRISQIGKPVFLATGASNFEETIRAVNLVLRNNPNLCIMQCNTNYTGDHDNFKFVNLNVLKSFAIKWPGIVLGLSDHTPGHSAVLGAVTLGARVIEKHFTDDNNRVGPDHSFALDPIRWKLMVDSTRELEMSLGDGIKRIEPNEADTVILQRRALRFVEDLPAGTILTKQNLQSLRPCPTGAYTPFDLDQVLGKVLNVKKRSGEAIFESDLKLNLN